MRTDLLSLNGDDLINLANKGTYKRARKEINLADLACQLADDDNALHFHWSDGAECKFPADKVLDAEDCSCPSTKICRHQLRSILYYQHLFAESCEISDWSPSMFSDEELLRFYSSTELSRHRRTYEQGLVIELVQGLKPLAVFHDLSLSLRFQVEGKLTYTHCDCDEQAPCSHVPMAIWAFRKLGDKKAGIEFHNAPPPDLTNVNDELDKILHHFFSEGINNLDSFTLQRFDHLQELLMQKRLIFPAEIVKSIHHLLTQYQQRDPRYDGLDLLAYYGELLIRLRALEQKQSQVPHTFIKGFKTSTTTGMKNCRFRGLGTLVREGRKTSEVMAIMQNERNGQIMAARRSYENVAEAPENFASLANRANFSSINARRLGGGRLLIPVLSCRTDRTLQFSRVKGNCQPQELKWGDLPGSVLCDDYQGLRRRLALLPPRSLRPRYVGQNFYVMKVAANDAPYLDTVNQSFVCKCFDANQSEVIIEHKYSTRGAQGFERLLHLCTHNNVKFVSGPIRQKNDLLLIEPAAVVIDCDGDLQLLQPFIDTYDEKGSGNQQEVPHAASPLYRLLHEIKTLIEDMLSNGAFSLSGATENLLQQLCQQTENLGLEVFHKPLREIQQVMAIRKMGADPACSLAPLKQLLLQLRLADDLSQSTD